MDAEYKDAVKQLRLGELRKALFILTGAATTEAGKDLPLYSECLKLAAKARREQVSQSLLSVAATLQLFAAKLREG